MWMLKVEAPPTSGGVRDGDDHPKQGILTCPDCHKVIFGHFLQEERPGDKTLVLTRIYLKSDLQPLVDLLEQRNTCSSWN
jgi:hypothetical protein